MEINQEKWDESYSRNENLIFYPKEEVIKFLNRFIKKRKGTTSFENLILIDSKLKALDLGCGIGRQTILFEEFGIEGYGVDISSVAITEAKKLSENMGFELNDRFQVLDKVEIPFDNLFFDFAISDSVLDSMEFTFAKKYLNELDRVVKQYVYISLIASIKLPDGSDFDGEIIVNETHENGTIQSFFTPSKIQELLSETSFEIVNLSLNTEKNMLTNNEHGRFHVVLKK
jgi:ubiquinone/menaquinone biosynthesis C-methylase UbiE